MARQLILETSFLIDLERGARRGGESAAAALLRREADSSLYVTFTSAGELAAGLSLNERDQWERCIAPFHVLPSTQDVCWEYGGLYRHLAGVGQLIGANDMWIAATAIAYGMQLVTRNEQHFRRAPNLETVSYA